MKWPSLIKFNKPTVSKPHQSMPSIPVDPAPYKWLGVFVVFGMLGGFFAWAGFAPLQSAIVGTGLIAVETRNKTVQHLEGGIVQKIHVKDGDQVAAGQLLIEMSDIQINSQFQMAQAQAYQALVNLDRIDAETNNQAQITWSAEVLSRADEPEMRRWMETQQQLMHSRVNAHRASIQARKDQINQATSQIEGYGKIIESLNRQVAAMQQDIEDMQALFKQKFVDKSRLREMEQQIDQYNTQVITYTTDRQKFQQQVAELNNQIQYLEEEYRKNLLTEYHNYRMNKLESLSRMRSLQDQLQRTKIYAPETGKVVGFEVVTLGAVIEPGRTIMQIVPQNQKFIVIAQVQPQDIDMVMPGQRVEIKFSAFNMNFMPVLFGEVDTVSADVKTDQATQASYYQVVVAITPDTVEELARVGWQLKPGMPAEAYIQTQQRTLVNYIIKPFRLLLARAFNEDDGF